MTSYIKKFNPYDLPEETLGAIATGRERVLGEILAIIAANAEGGRVQHLQVVAPRGYGKSFLMRMVQSALKVRVAEGLPAVLALLPEEQHNVDAPHRLLNEIQRLVEGRPANSLLGGAFEESDGAWEEAVATLDAAIAAKLPQGCGIAVAIVENFDQLISDVFRKPRDQSRLRALLDRPGGRLMLLATATRRADAAYEQRLFHATRLIELEPWQEESCLAFFERLRGHRRAGPMSPQLQAKAKALAQFIGGSPRMATVLAEVLENNDSLRVAQMLDALVDELTPYYKHRIESLSRRARTLLDALLRMGEPRTQSEIAARLGVVQSRIAEPFNELRAGGEVVGVKAQHSSEMLYRVSDRLMAHYYRKRHLGVGDGASLLEGIVEFLESFYTPEEKRAEAERLRALGRAADAAVFDRLTMAGRALLDTGHVGPKSEEDWLDGLWEILATLAKTGRIKEGLALCQQAVKQAATSGDLRQHARSLRCLGWTLSQMGQHVDAQETLRRALVLAEQVNDRMEQAHVSRHLGWSLGEMNQHTEAEQVLRRALSLSEQVGDDEGQMDSALFLGWNLGAMGQHAEAEQALRRALAQAEQLSERFAQAEALLVLGTILRQMERYAEAQELVRRALELGVQDGKAALTAWAALELLRVAQAISNDAQVVMAWQHVRAAVAAAPIKERLPDITLWFDDAAVAALRSQQFDAFWGSCGELPLKKRAIGSAQSEIAAAITEANQTQGRAAAYALASQAIQVLAEDAAGQVAQERPVGCEPLSFLRGILSKLARLLNDPALLRDIAALLEQRMPSETVVERTLLEAAAQRAESPDDPAVLERVDPDIAIAVERMLGAAPQGVSKKQPQRGKSGSRPRRKK